MRSARRTAAGATRRPFPTRESAAWLCRAYIDLDPEGCALARSASEVVGVGFAHPRGAVTSIGPLAARPGAPAGVARALMNELGDIAARLRPASGCSRTASIPIRSAFTRGSATRSPTSRRTCWPRSWSRPPPGTRPGRAAAGGRRPARDRALRSIAHRRRPAARPRAAGVDGRRVRVPAERARRASPAISSIARCRRASSSVPAVAESAEILAALVDGVAASLPGRPAVIRASAAAPAMLERAFERGFLVDHLGQPHGRAGRTRRRRPSSTRCSPRVSDREPRQRRARGACRAAGAMVCCHRLEAAGRPRRWVGSWTFAAIVVRPNTSSRTIASPTGGASVQCTTCGHTFVVSRRKPDLTPDARSDDRAGRARLGAHDRGRQDAPVSRSDHAAEVDRRASRAAGTIA